MHDEVDDMLAPRLLGGAAGEVAAKNSRQGRRVGKKEIAQPGNRDVKVNRADAAAKRPGLDPFAEYFRNHADQRRMHGFQPAGTADVTGAAAVLVIEEQDEVGMGGEMVERALDQLADRGF